MTQILDTLSVPNPNATTLTAQTFGKFSTASGSDSGIIATCAAGDSPDGVIRYGTDGVATLDYDGLLQVTAGGSIPAGSEIKVGSSGKAVAISAGDVPCGKYLGGSTASTNDVIDIQFYRKGRNNVTASGSATLVGGTVTVSTTAVQSTSIVKLYRQALGGTAGHLSVGTITAATSFVINSSSGTDTSVIFWEVIN